MELTLYALRSFNAEQGTPANAGRRSRLHSHAFGPAWLRFAFGQVVLCLKLGSVEKASSWHVCGFSKPTSPAW
jgi:hypothetical protein